MRVNSAFLTCTVNPEASVLKMQIMGKFASWLFAWDDSIDFGDVGNGLKQRELLHVEMTSIIRKSLLDDSTLIQDPAMIAPTYPLAQSFYEIGVQIREAMELASIRKFFCDTLCDYVTAAIKLQDAFVRGVILELEEYLDIRMSSSGVYPTIALSIYGQHTDLPAWFLDHPLAKEMMRHINIMVSLDNDIVSARHEVQCNHVDNMIPLLIYHRGMTPQEAVDHCSQLIRDSYTAFNALEPELVDLAAAHGITEEVRIFLSCCEDVRIGLVNWLYTIKRYVNFEPGQESTEVLVVLGK